MSAAFAAVQHYRWLGARGRTWGKVLAFRPRLRPLDLAPLRWSHLVAVIEAGKHPNPGELAEALHLAARDGTATPAELVNLIADLVDGTKRNPRGRPRKDRQTIAYRIATVQGIPPELVAYLCDVLAGRRKRPPKRPERAVPLDLVETATLAARIEALCATQPRRRSEEVKAAIQSLRCGGMNDNRPADYERDEIEMARRFMRREAESSNRKLLAGLGIIDGPAIPAAADEIVCSLSEREAIRRIARERSEEYQRELGAAEEKVRHLEILAPSPARMAILERARKQLARLHGSRAISEAELHYALRKQKAIRRKLQT